MGVPETTHRLSSLDWPQHHMVLVREDYWHSELGLPELCHRCNWFWSCHLLISNSIQLSWTDLEFFEVTLPLPEETGLLIRPISSTALLCLASRSGELLLSCAEATLSSQLCFSVKQSESCNFWQSPGVCPYLDNIYKYMFIITKITLKYTEKYTYFMYRNRESTEWINWKYLSLLHLLKAPASVSSYLHTNNTFWNFQFKNANSPSCDGRVLSLTFEQEMVQGLLTDFRHGRLL